MAKKCEPISEDESAVSISLRTCLLFLALVNDVTGHGGMVEPPMRSIMWRAGFDAPVNYDWNSLYCGGFHKFQQSGGKCGLCGDPYRGPFENDKGGVYDTGIIVRHYPVGLREIEVKVELTAHHKGYMQFKLCPNNEHPLTKACLDRYPLMIQEGQRQGDPYKYEPPESPKLHELHVILPPDVTCDRCVLQWTYTAGNSAGVDPNGRSCIGCGLQETFVNCADISIGGTMDRVPAADNPTEPVTEVVIPTRKDTVDIIQKATPDTSIREVLRQMQPSTDDARDRPDTPTPRPRTTQTVRPRRTRPLVPISNQRDTHTFQTLRGERERIAAIERQRAERRRRLIMLSRNPALRPNRAGFNRGDISPSQSMRVRGSTTTLGDLRHSHRRQSQNQNRRSKTLLETMNRAIEDIRRSNNPRRMFSTPSNRRNRVSRKQGSRVTETGVDIFGDPTGDRFNSLRERVPSGAQWIRSDGRSSYRDAVRQARQFSGVNIPLGTIRQHVPELPQDILPRKDIDPMASRRRASAFGNNWFMESRTESPSNKGQGRDTLPRRIVVHSMMVAQHLLRKFPQLRGRVFLSREAHTRSTFAHMTNKYRLRQRWQ